MPYESFFGKRDAGQENPNQLIQYYHRQEELERLKSEDKAEGACVIAGVKGSGKTAICKVIEYEQSQYGIGWTLNISDGFSVNNDTRQSSYFRSLLIVHLLSKLTQLISRNQENFSKEALDALPGAISKLRSLAETILGNTTASVDSDGISISLDIRELLNLGQGSLSQFSLEQFFEMLSPCLSERGGYILVDDVDEIFPGSDQNYEFIEGLIAAAVDINSFFGNLLHCLVFLKAGAYSLYFEHGRNYDKYGEEATIVLRWGSTELTEMMAIRSRVAAGVDDDEELPWKSLGRSFGGRKNDILSSIDYMLERSNSGPRDLVIFGNLAKQIAGTQKISLDDLKDQENRYSQEKLFLLNRDYSMQYGDVANLIAKVFRRQPAIFSKGKLEKFIQTQILGNSEVMNGEFSTMQLLRSRDAARVLTNLFDFGFIGFRSHPELPFMYMMDMQSDLVVPGVQLLDAYEHRIHPAYQGYLMLNLPD